MRDDANLVPRHNAARRERRREQRTCGARVRALTADPVYVIRLGNAAVLVLVVGSVAKDRRSLTFSPGWQTAVPFAIGTTFRFVEPGDDHDD